MKKFVTVSLFVLALLSAGPAAAKTFYLSDGSTIEYKRVWKQGGLIYLLVNRDTLVAFLPEEVDQRRTLRAAGMKMFPRPAAVKKKPVRVAAKRVKAAPALSTATEPGVSEEKAPAFNDYPEKTPETSSPVTKERNVPAGATANGKYSGLVQVMHCPKDRGSYGEFRDYGWWSGGPWCGQTGKAGYWVWVAPDWYVWSGKN